MISPLRLCLGTIVGCLAAQVPAAPQVSLTSSKTTLSVSVPTQDGQVILTATPTSSAGGVCTGLVNFVVDGMNVAASQVLGPFADAPLAAGSAVNTIRLPRGSHEITAVFQRSQSCAGSQSARVKVNITSANAAQPILTIAQIPSGAVTYTYVAKQGAPLPGPVSLVELSSGAVLDTSRPEVSTEPLPSITVSTTALGRQVSTSVVADFNGDGLSDVLVGDTSAQTAILHLQDANSPSLTAGVIVPLGLVPNAMTTEDYNQDGLPDVAVVDSAAGTLTVLFGESGSVGSFAALGSSIQVDAGAAKIISGDFNSDGFIDLAVTNPLQNTVTILLNNAADPGRFVSSQVLNLSGGVYGITAGDVYGHGLLDLVVSSYVSGEVWVLENNPAQPGLFAVPSTVQRSGAGASALLLSDLNADGATDLVVCNALEDTVDVFLADKNDRGIYKTAQIVAVSPSPSSVLAVPSKRGGLMDLLVSSHDDGLVEVLSNTGSGSFVSTKLLGAGQTTDEISWFDSGNHLSPDVMVLDLSSSSLQRIEKVMRTSGLFAALKRSGSETIKVVAKEQQLGSNDVIESNVLNIDSGATLQGTNIVDAVYGRPLPLSDLGLTGDAASYSVTVGKGLINGSVLVPLASGPLQVSGPSPKVGDESTTLAVLATLRVRPAELIVVGDPATRVFAQSNPVFTGQTYGLRRDDVIQVAFSSAADVTTPTGVYRFGPDAVTPSVTADASLMANYSLIIKPGTLTITSPPASSSTSTTSTPSSTSGQTTSTPTQTSAPIAPVVLNPLAPMLPPTIVSGPTTSPVGVSDPLGTNPVPRPPIIAPTQGPGQPVLPSPINIRPLPPIELPRPEPVHNPPSLPILGSGLPPFSFPIQLGTPFSFKTPFLLPLPIPLPSFHLGGKRTPDSESSPQIMLVHEGPSSDGSELFRAELRRVGSVNPSGLIYVFEGDDVLASAAVRGQIFVTLKIRFKDRRDHILRAGYAADTVSSSAVSQPLVFSAFEGADRAEDHSLGKSIAGQEPVSHSDLTTLLSKNDEMPFSGYSSNFLRLPLPTIETSPTGSVEPYGMATAIPTAQSSLVPEGMPLRSHAGKSPAKRKRHTPIATLRNHKVQRRERVKKRSDVPHKSMRSSKTRHNKQTAISR